MKAILIIDIPEDVEEAYSDLYVDYDLRGTSKDDLGVVESIRYIEEAVLKPMPEKKEHLNCEGCNHIECEYAEGWDDCLEEIENGSGRAFDNMFKDAKEPFDKMMEVFDDKNRKV